MSKRSRVAEDPPTDCKRRKLPQGCFRLGELAPGSVPIAEIIYSWSKIVRGNCRIVPDAWYCKIERKVETKGKSTLVTERLAGPYKVTGELENGKLQGRHYVFGAENKLVKG